MKSKITTNEQQTVKPEDETVARAKKLSQALELLNSAGLSEFVLVIAVDAEPLYSMALCSFTKEGSLLNVIEQATHTLIEVLHRGSECQPDSNSNLQDLN